MNLQFGHNWEESHFHSVSTFPITVLQIYRKDRPKVKKYAYEGLVVGPSYQSWEISLSSCARG